MRGGDESGDYLQALIREQKVRRIHAQKFRDAQFFREGSAAHQSGLLMTYATHFSRSPFPSSLTKISLDTDTEN
jgi:hypothetical protein